MLPYLWQKRFHCTIKVCGGPSKLYIWKISSLHYIWCFPLKLSFVNRDKFAGIRGWFELTNEIPNIKGNIILWEKCPFCINFICLMTISSQGILPPWYRTKYKQYTFSAIRFSIRNYIKILCYASLRSSRLAVLLNIFWNFSESILMELY